MNHSESLKELAAALSKAQGEFEAIPKNRTAEIPAKAGGKYTYRYADLADLISAVTPALSRNGLSITQSPTLIEGRLTLETTIMHASGEWKSGFYPLQSFERAQEMGSEITYARRYTLAAMLGVHAEEDEDGNLATQGSPKNSPPVATVRPIPNALRVQLKDGDVYCERCNTALLVSGSGEGMYCPRFKDASQGEHTRFHISKLEGYRAMQKVPS